MGPSTTEPLSSNARAGTPVPVAQLAPASPPQRPAGRGAIIGGTALVVCAAVVAGLVVANKTPADPGQQAVAGSITGGVKPLDVSDPTSGKPIEAPPLAPEIVKKEVEQILTIVKKRDDTIFKQEVESQEHE